MHVLMALVYLAKTWQKPPNELSNDRHNREPEKGGPTEDLCSYICPNQPTTGKSVLTKKADPKHFTWKSHIQWPPHLGQRWAILYPTNMSYQIIMLKGIDSGGSGYCDPLLPRRKSPHPPGCNQTELGIVRYKELTFPIVSQAQQDTDHPSSMAVND